MIRTFGNSQFWANPASFVYYYSLILGAAAIRTFREPRGPVTWNSSKLVVLDYTRVVGMLLVTDFGSSCDPTVSESPGSGYAELVKTHSSGLFWRVCTLLLTDFGSRCDPNFSRTSGSAYGELVKTRSFGLFRPVCMLLVTDFGSRCDPNVSANPLSG